MLAFINSFKVHGQPLWAFLIQFLMMSLGISYLIFLVKGFGGGSAGSGGSDGYSGSQTSGGMSASDITYYEGREDK